MFQDLEKILSQTSSVEVLVYRRCLVNRNCADFSGEYIFS